MNIYDEDKLVQLEQDEHEITEEALSFMFMELTFSYIELEKELRNFYQKYGKDGIVTYAEARKWVSDKKRQKRINVLLATITVLFGRMSTKLSAEFGWMVNKTIIEELRFFELLDKIDVKDIPLKWGFDKFTWRERLENDVFKWTAQIRADVKQGILQRKHLDEILEGLTKRFESIETVLEALGISETSAVGSLARNQIFKELGISEYKIYTREDERRCKLCGTMHGKVFPMVEYEPGVTASPFHTRCRCWEVPLRPKN